MTKLILSVFAAVAACAQTSPPGSTTYPETTQLPAGEFQMGDHYDFVDPQHPSDERPLHMVWIEALIIGVYDVTNNQYVEFLNSAYTQGQLEVRNNLVYAKGGTNYLVDLRPAMNYSSIVFDGAKFIVTDFRGLHPVGVTWFGAIAYTNWLSPQQSLQPCYDLVSGKVDFTKSGWRLPTEAEWEYAARGGEYSPYYNFPWGNDSDNTKANWPGASTPEQGPDPNNPFHSGPQPWTTPAGFYNGKLHTRAEYNWPGAQATFQSGKGTNSWGLYDMSGNIWQWVNDWYGTNYYSASPYRNPPGPDEGSPMPDGKPYRNMRGGSWYNGGVNDPGHARVSNRDPGYYRAPDNPNGPYYHTGFRVARFAATPVTPALTAVSAASFAGAPVAPDSLVSLFGSGLAGGAVTIKDSAGTTSAAQVLGTAATQINFVMPARVAAGEAAITVTVNGATIAGTTQVQAVAPGLFSANATGKGVAAANAVLVKSDGAQTAQNVFRCGTAAGSCVAVPLDLGSGSDQLYLSLFGTGMRNFTQKATATIGGVNVSIAGPVAQGQFAGLDQLNLGPIPRTLAGKGELDVLLTVDAKPANVVSVAFR
jgi:uncharacterized protein (TIGR03437 family)